MEAKSMSFPVESQSVLQSVLRRVTRSAEFERLAAEVAGGARIVSVGGLTSAPARALAVAALRSETGRRFAVIVPSNRDAEAWERDLSFWHGALAGEGEEGARAGDAVLALPSSESDPYAGASPHAETLERRALTLWRLARGGAPFVLLTARALARRTARPAKLLESGARLRRDEDFAPEQLVELLHASGYVREDPVAAVGEFSLRGGILDVWSPGDALPLRMEFFGDTVDSIRRFDPETQLSVAQLQEAEIVPMRELTAGAEDFRLWAMLARERWPAEAQARALKDRTTPAEEGETFAGWEWLMPLAATTDASAFDYLGDAVLVVDEPAGVEQYLSSTYENMAARFAENEAAGEIGLRPEELYLSPSELREKLSIMRRIEFRALGRSAALVDERFAGEAEQPAARIGRERAAPPPLFLFSALEAAPEVEWRTLPARRYHGRVPDLAVEARRAYTEARATRIFLMPSLGVA
jgi:transcription-repair coupling factor (superfamily II helicase)